MITIAVDIGASFLKGARITEDGTISAMVERVADAGMGESGLKITRIVRMVSELLEELPGPDVEYRLAFSTEMHGFILADESGEPLTDYVSWQTEYGNTLGEDSVTYLEKFKRLVGEYAISRTGMPARAGLPSVNLYYLLKSEYRCTSKSSNVYFYTLGDYVVRKLTGQRPFIHVTNAAATGLYDMEHNCWCREIIQAIGADGIMFPEVVSDNRCFAAVLAGKKVCVLPAIGDQQAALLGSGLSCTTELSVNFGTGAQISVLTDKLEFSDQYQLRPFFYGKYLKTIPHIPAGRALNVYIRFIKEIARVYKGNVTNDEIWNLVTEKVGCQTKSMLELNMGFFSNPVSSGLRGSIGNIGEYDFSVGSLFLSAFRTMAENVACLYLRLGEGEPDRLIFSGGVARKNKIFRSYVIAKFKPSAGYMVADRETIKGLLIFANMRHLQ